MKEIWRAIKDFPGYEISNTGKARSIDRRDSRGRFLKGKELKIKVPNYQPLDNMTVRYVRLRRYGKSFDRDFDILLYKHFTKDELDLPPQDALERP